MPPKRQHAPGHRPAGEDSTITRMLQRLRSGRDVRRSKVKRIRSSIRAGTYDNDLKLSVALDRLLKG